MKKLDQNKRDEVIRLFFSGYSYDEITERLDIAKGSVVNIIEEFRSGTLSVPPDLMTCIDELRHVAVDLKKLHASPKKMKSSLRLQDKLLDMGVSEREVERWLDICQFMARPDLTGRQFIAAALDLARLIKENGMSFDELFRDYDLKLTQLKDVEDKIEGKQLMLQLKEKELRELQSAIKEHVERAAYHMQRRQKPIQVHHSYHLTPADKHSELPMKQTTGRCINYR